MSSLILCDHCGETIIIGRTGASLVRGNHYHDSCERDAIPRCRHALGKFIDENGIKHHVLYTGANLQYINGTPRAREENMNKVKQERRVKRDAKTKEILKIASALRNSGSGYLLIQFVGMSEHDSFTGLFDEMVDVKLNALIEDGSLFTDVYKKIRIPGCNDVLVLFVAGSSHLITTDYFTKIALDNSIENPRASTVCKFLFKTEKSHWKKENKISSQNVGNIQESREIQIKTFWKNKERRDIVDRVWIDLRLREYISAFSKNSTGGAYLLGVGEREVEFGNYISKRLEFSGIGADSKERDAMIRAIEKKVRDNVLVCSAEGQKLSPDNLVTVAFMPVLRSSESSSSSSVKCGATQDFRSSEDQVDILVVHVNPVNGIVFYDKQGPLAYRIVEQDGEPAVKEVTLEEWFHSMKETSKVMAKT